MSRERSCCKKSAAILVLQLLNWNNVVAPSQLIPLDVKLKKKKKKDNEREGAAGGVRPTLHLAPF